MQDEAIPDSEAKSLLSREAGIHTVMNGSPVRLLSSCFHKCPKQSLTSRLVRTHNLCRVQVADCVTSDRSISMVKPHSN